MTPEEEIDFRYKSLDNMQNVIRALDLKASFLLLGFASLPIANVDKLINWIKTLPKDTSYDLLYLMSFLLLLSWILFIGFLILTIKPLNLDTNQPDYQQRKASIFFVTRPRIELDDIEFGNDETIAYHLKRQQIALGEILSKKRKNLQRAFFCLIPIVILGMIIILLLLIK